MRDPSLFLLEFRRLAVSLALAVGVAYLSSNWLLGSLSGTVALLLSWGWQLSKIYRWFANPDEMPPIGGSGMRGILHDVYVLRSRGLNRGAGMQRSQPFLRDSLASMREAALILDPQGRLIWCNAAAEYLLALRFADQEGNELSHIIKDKKLGRYLEEDNFQKPLRVNPGPDPELCLQFEFSRFGANERLVFVKDVTDQEKLDRMRRDFVGNVSHELRTPLTVIKGYVETLQGLPEIDQQVLAKAFRSMDTQTARMENLIADLLWLTQIESEEGERKEDVIDMRQLLTTLCDELRAAWPDRAIKLDLRSSLLLQGNLMELRSAISNLIINALKYSEKKPVKVIWADTGVGPAISVEDRGIGIEAKHIPRITERFYRVDKSRSQATGGTGLGLAIVKHVAVSHEARLFVDSEKGRGSCFRLVFPSSRVVEA